MRPCDDGPGRTAIRAGATLLEPDQSRFFHLQRQSSCGASPPHGPAVQPGVSAPLPCCDGCSFSPLPCRSVAKAAVERRHPLIPRNSGLPYLDMVRSVDRGQLRILLSRDTERGIAFAAGGGEVTRCEIDGEMLGRLVVGRESLSPPPGFWRQGGRTMAATRAVRRHTRRRRALPCCTIRRPWILFKIVAVWANGADTSDGGLTRTRA